MRDRQVTFDQTDHERTGPKGTQVVRQIPGQEPTRSEEGLSIARTCPLLLTAT
jgi:hypothetical protein